MQNPCLPCFKVITVHQKSPCINMNDITLQYRVTASSAESIIFILYFFKHHLLSVFY